VQVVEEARSLVPNGSFEIGTAAVGFPHEAYRAGAETHQLVPDTRNGRLTTVAMLANTDKWDQTGYLSDPLYVETGHLYLQAGWIRGEAGNAYFGQRWTTVADGRTSRTYVVHSVSPGEWTHYAALAIPPEGAGQTQVWLSNHRTEGKVFFDNVIFVEVDRLGRLP
jgi:hypothetical protein